MILREIAGAVVERDLAEASGRSFLDELGVADKWREMDEESSQDGIAAGNVGHAFGAQ